MTTGTDSFLPFLQWWEQVPNSVNQDKYGKSGRNPIQRYVECLLYAKLCMHSQQSSFLPFLLAQSLRRFREETDRFLRLQSLFIVPQRSQDKPRHVLTNDNRLGLGRLCEDPIVQ